MNKAREFDQSVLAELKALRGERVSTSAAVREHHGKDESYFPYALPDAVVFPETTDEVRDVVNICRRHRVPMIPFGVGTSLEGHILAIQGGVSIDLSQMNQVLAVHEEDLDAVVQAGVTRKQLNEYLKHTGLFFPVDPGADATLGGMAATRASGTNAVRYGTMRENVLALAVVLADGRVITTSRRSRKSAAGYELTRLFVGSEGTLGIITELTVRLYAVPEAMSAATCSFPDIAGAVQAKLVQGIAHENGGMDFEWTTKAEDRTRLWTARHQAYFACLQLRPGSRAVSTDVCVPISRLTECIVKTSKDISRASMPIPLFGHVGDGNFHCEILILPDDETELAEARSFNERVVNRALAMEGTCTGEHGIGFGKMRSLRKELGEAVDLMASLKRAIDPENLMNPGKVVAFSG